MKITSDFGIIARFVQHYEHRAENTPYYRRLCADSLD